MNGLQLIFIDILDLLLAVALLSLAILPLGRSMALLLPSEGLLPCMSLIPCLADLLTHLLPLLKELTIVINLNILLIELLQFSSLRLIHRSDFRYLLFNQHCGFIVFVVYRN